MSAPVVERLMTTKELLAMPEDGMDRWLINGELREKPMTKRSEVHSTIMAELTADLVFWVRSQSRRRGKIVCGEAGIRLRRSPDTTVGVDIAYVPRRVKVTRKRETTLIDGPPILAVEILSPNDKHEEIHEKIDSYLECGVAVVWIVNPDDHTIKAYTVDEEPKLFTRRDELTAEPHLPGFRLKLSTLFDA